MGKRMKFSRPLTVVYAAVIAFSILPSAHAATYLITFYENTSSTSNNLFTDYTIAGTATFTIADSAVTPNNLVMFSDPEFLSFEVSLALSRGDSSTFTLGIDDFQLGNYEERGILFDSAGNPYRFDQPTTFVSDNYSMCEPSCSLAEDNMEFLSLNDFDNYQEVFLNDGTIINLSGVAPGTPYTPLAGLWNYKKGVNVGGSGVREINGRIHISAVPIPAAFWLFGSGLLGLIGISRRKKAA